MEKLHQRMNAAVREIDGIFKEVSAAEDKDNRGGQFVTVLLGLVLGHMYKTTQPAMETEQAKRMILEYLNECVDQVVTGAKDGGNGGEDFTRFVPM